jgi:hypothetical protein
MQTFLPHANFRLSAHVLDSSRLGKQRSEAVQILRALARGSMAGWFNHPATTMWRGFEPALALYASLVINEWLCRGYRSSMICPRTAEGAEHWQIPLSWALDEPEMPDWVGMERLHASHRAALLLKSPSWYTRFDWDEVPRSDYFWPASIPAVGRTIVAPDNSVWVVLERTSEGLLCNCDGRQTVVSIPDIRTRVWRSASRS